MPDSNIAKKRINIKEYAVLCIFILLNSALIFISYENFTINADISNHILEAKDIVHGNFFYRDWNLSQISFLFSDIVFYAIGYLVFGVDRKAALLCFAIANVVTQLILYCVCIYKTKYSWKAKALIAGIIVIPAAGFLWTDTVHFGAWIYCIIGCWLYFRLVKESETAKYNKIRLILIVIWVLGIFSDFLVFLCGALPCMLYSLLQIYHKEKRGISDFKNPLTQVYSLTIAYILEFFYYLIGGANRVGTVAGFEFVSVSQWGENIVRFISFLLRMFGADFTGKKAFMPDNILRCFNALILLFAINYLVMVLISIIKKKENGDILSEILALGIVVDFLVFMMTTRSRDNYSIFVPISLYIILIRNMHMFEKWSRHNWKINMFAAVMVVLMALAGRAYDIVIKMKTPYNEPHEELAAFLVDNSLECGYASFWDASICTILSNEKVRVRHIEYGTNGMSEYMWFNKNGWYKEEAHFVILHSDPDHSIGQKDYWGIIKENVENYFGKPDSILYTGEYEIYLYDKDLSQELAIPDMRTMYL